MSLSKLAPLETEVIALFVHLARLVNVPKSAAEIYGLLFISPRPLGMDEIVLRLSLSKGSASQGLKLLRGFNAVRLVYVAGKRNDHYEAELELRHLVQALLRDKWEAHFVSGQQRLSRILALLHELQTPERETVGSRVEKLRDWQQSGDELLPLMRKVLIGATS